MSFSATLSGHTDSQEEFEAVVNDLKQFVADHSESVTFASLSGTDHNGESRGIDFHAVLRQESGEDETTDEGAVAEPTTEGFDTTDIATKSLSGSGYDEDKGDEA